LPPHPNPPPRRGEGRVGVMLLEIFMQRLGSLLLAGWFNDYLFQTLYVS